MLHFRYDALLDNIWIGKITITIIGKSTTIRFDYIILSKMLYSSLQSYTTLALRHNPKHHVYLASARDISLHHYITT